MKILFAGRPARRVISIEPGRALAHPGVVAVFTARDVPNNEYGLIVPDQPVLCGPGTSKPGADRVRFVGDQVAVVVAETETAAAAAARLIDVVYQDLPVVADLESALAAGATILHPDHESNVFCHYRIRKGDVPAALARSAVVVRREYRTPMQEHAYLAPEAGIAYLDDQGRVTVEVAGQWTHEDRQQIAHALGLPEDQVRVIYPAIGGAFGGREDMSVQIVLALAAWRLAQRGIRRPVRIVWSREESILGHHKRHAFLLRATWGADARRETAGGGHRSAPGRRRLRLHLHQGTGQRHVDVHRSVRNPARVGRRLFGVHEQHPRRGVPRLRRSAGRLRRREPDQPAGRGAGDRPGRDSPAECPAGRCAALGWNTAAQGRVDHPGGRALRRRNQAGPGRRADGRRLPGNEPVGPRPPTSAEASDSPAPSRTSGSPSALPSSRGPRSNCRAAAKSNGPLSTTPAPSAGRAPTR